MHEHLRVKLNQNFEAEIRERVVANERKLEADERIRRDLILFEDVRRRLIRPRMEELACFLADHFIPTQISQDERRYDPFGRMIGSVGITIRAFVNCSAKDPISDVPHYAIYWEAVNRLTRFYSNANARHMAGELLIEGKATLHEITSDLIDDNLLKFARAVI